MTVFAPGAEVLLITTEPGKPPLHVTVVRKTDERCIDCGGAAYEVRSEQGETGLFCESSLRRAN